MQRSSEEFSNIEHQKFLEETKKSIIPLLSESIETASKVPNFSKVIEENMTIVKLNQGLNHHVFSIEIQDLVSNLDVRLIVKMNTKFNNKDSDPTTFYYSRIREHIKYSHYGPKIYYEDDTWTIEEKVIGHTLTPEDMSNDEVCLKIMEKAADYANKMKDMETKDLNKENIVIDLINRGIIEKIQEESSIIKQTHSKELSDVVEKVISLFYDEKIKKICESVNHENYEFLVTHGDLNPFNIMKNDLDGDMVLLDYENSCFHAIGYDIAYVLMNRLSVFKNNKMYFEEKRFHSEEFLRLLTKRYLENLEVFKAKSGNDDFFENVVECVKKCLVNINLFWSIWSIFKIRFVKAEFDWISSLNVRLDVNNFLMNKYFS